MAEPLNFEEISFGIISYAGEAKGEAVSAIKKAKEGSFEEAQKFLEQADNAMVEAEKQHMAVITREAAGEKVIPTVLFLHAEDQLLSTQTFMLVAQQFIDLYKQLYEKK